MNQKHRRTSRRRRAVLRRECETRAVLRRDELDESREGSTLVVVISLLALLSVLGITINLYVSQEVANSEYMAEAAKVRDESGLDPDALFDFGVEQVILGAGDDFPQSALHGGRYALLADLFGRDHRPFNGRGVNVVDLDGDGVPEVDQNYNGLADDGTAGEPDNRFLLKLNYSAAANGGLSDQASTGIGNVTSPDADYTAPDLNAAWLTYESWGLDDAGQPVRVVKPAYGMQQYLRNSGGGYAPVRFPDATSLMNDGTPISSLVLHPHRDHVVAGNPGVLRFIRPGDTEDLNNNGTLDAGEDLDGDGFVTSAHPNPYPFADAARSYGVWNMETAWRGGGGTGFDYSAGDWLFPPAGVNPNRLFFKVTTDNGSSDPATEPTWGAYSPGNTFADGALVWTAFKYPEYDFGGDADGNGLSDSIPLDLGFPVQERGDKTLFVPIFYFKIEDADALGNVNVHSNYAGNANPDEIAVFGSILDPAAAPNRVNRFVTESNQGLTPFEVNLGWILNADPSDVDDGFAAGDFDRLNVLFSQTFGSGTGWQELSNVELFTLMTGIVHTDSGGNVEELVAGRYGEVNQMLQAWQNVAAGADGFPKAGLSNADDDGNERFGEQVLSGRQASANYQPGQWVVATVTDGAVSPTVLLACVSAGQTSNDNIPMVSSVESGAIVNEIGGGATVQWMIFDTPLYSFGDPYDIRGSGYRNYRVGMTHATFGTPAAPGKSLIFEDATPTVFQSFSNYGTYTFNKRFREGVIDAAEYEPWYLARVHSGNPFFDDPGELFTTDGNLDGSNPNDAVFTAADAAFLRYSKAVLDSRGTTSRLAKLMAWNLVLNERAEEIRKRLTPVSWDLRTRGTLGRDGSEANTYRGWEYGAAGEFPPEFSDGSVTVARGAANYPFREATRRLIRDTNDGNQGANVPLQDVVQRLLSLNHVVDLVGPGNDGIWGTGDDDATEGPNERPFFRRLTSHPTFVPNTAIGTLALGSMTTLQRQEHEARRDRQKLARDVYMLLYTIGGGWDGVNYAGTDNSDLGSGVRNLYNDDQLEEMARFAVNFVDQLDPDDVITKFEYDTNPNNGWDLDDNPYGAVEITPDRAVVFGVERQSLTFSEALVVVADLADNGGSAVDHPRTEWNDQLALRDWTFLELRNASATPASFENEAWKIVVQPLDKDPMATTVNARHLIPRSGAGSVGGGALFTIGTAGDGDLMDGGNVAPTRMRIDRTDPRDGDFTDPEDFRIPSAALGSFDLDLIDPNHEGRFRLHDSTTEAGVDRVDPPIGTTNGVEQGTKLPNDTNKGDFLSLDDAMDAVSAQPGVEFVLMRRAHPYRTPPVEPTDTNAATYGPQSADNPWIEVDRITTDVKGFDQLDGSLADTASLTQVDNNLVTLQSSARSEPFVRDEDRATNGAYAATATVKNSIGAVNKVTTDNLGGTFGVRQFHPDRDFTSPVDLFLVPLFGPHDVTHGERGMTNVVDGFPRQAYPNLAGAAKFLKPVAEGAYGTDGRPGVGGTDDNTDSQIDDWRERQELPGDNEPNPDPSVLGGAGDGTWKYDNRWYRLLGFVETPSALLNVTNPTVDQATYRLPGRINWNTLRYPEVLAALVDDEGAVDPATGFAALDPSGAKQTGYLADRYEGAGVRDWWIDFLKSRDGIDPVTGLVLPGMPGGRPFRSTSFLRGEQGSPQGIEQTMLRGLWTDLYDDTTGIEVDSPLVRTNVLTRRLLELGTPNERYGANPPATTYNDTAGHAVDPETRHRLLSKVWNNSTTRSNVVFLHVQIDFHQVGNGGTAANPAYRIGGKLTDMPSHRGFFVIDRSRAFELLRPEHFRAAAATSPYSFKRVGDPQLGAGEEGFDFRDLILYREVLE